MVEFIYFKKEKYEGICQWIRIIKSKSIVPSKFHKLVFYVAISPPALFWLLDLNLSQTLDET